VSTNPDDHDEEQTDILSHPCFEFGGGEYEGVFFTIALRWVDE
jgi:hypothetical protein